MFRIEISETVENKLDFIDVLNRISELIEAGNNSGFSPDWDIALDIQKQSPQQSHVIEVTALRNGAATVLKSYYYDQELTIPFTNEPGAITFTLDTAKKYMENNGFNIVSVCAGKRQEVCYIVSDTFKPLVK